MLTHYAAKGFVPDSSFAEVCFSTGSFYSDPVAIRAGLVEGADATSDAASESSADERRILASPMRQLFSGAALFREGILVARLDAERTKLLSLIRGETKSICCEHDGRTVELTVESGRANYNADLGFICRKAGVLPAGVGMGKTQDWTPYTSSEEE